MGCPGSLNITRISGPGVEAWGNLKSRTGQSDGNKYFKSREEALPCVLEVWDANSGRALAN